MDVAQWGTREVLVEGAVRKVDTESWEKWVVCIREIQEVGLVSLCSHRMSKVSLWEVWKVVGLIEQVPKNVFVKDFEMFADVLR